MLDSALLLALAPMAVERFEQGGVCVLFPVSREFCLGDRFATDCPVSQPVRSLGCYFPAGENRRHSRRLGWGAPVSGQQFLVFRSLRGGFRAPGPGRYSPISRSPV